MKAAVLLLLCLLLCACARQPSAVVQPPAEEVPTAPSQTVPDEPAEAAKEPPYIEKVKKTTLEIMKGPGYGTDFVSLLEPGAYTVVEEATDENGLLWGRLKSGIGWIDLTYNREIFNVFGPVTVEDSTLGAAADHTFVPQDFTDYGSHYLLTVTEPITDLQLQSCEFRAAGPSPAEVLFRLDRLEKDQCLAFTLVFWGDMTTYALTFTDASGHTHTCTMMQSGRDGSLILSPYEP